MPNRMDKINALLTEEVGAELGRIGSLGPQGSLATVTAVQATTDLREAVVWVSLLPDEDTAWEALLERQRQLQAYLAGRLRIKRTPRISLRRDRSGQHAERISELLEHA